MPLAVHDEGCADCNSTNDLLVLCLGRIGDHLVKHTLAGLSKHDQTHGVSGSFGCSRVVLEEDVLQLVVDVLIASCEGSHTQTKRCSVLHNRVICVGQALAELRLSALFPSSVDKAKGEQSSTFTELGWR